MSSVGRKRSIAHGILNFVSGAPGDYIVFFDDGIGNVVSSYYARESWVSDISTVAVSAAFNANFQCFIPHDTNGLVADSSVVYLPSGNTTLVVVDPTTAVAFDYACGAGRRLAGSVGFYNGKLYWVEKSQTTGGGFVVTATFYLMRSGCDLSGATQLGSHSPDLTLMGASITSVDPLGGPAISASAICVSFETDIDEVGTARDDASFTLSGAGTDSYDGTAGDRGTSNDVTAGIVSGASALVGTNDGTFTRPDGLETVLAALWTFATFSSCAISLPVGGDLCVFDAGIPMTYRAPAASAGSATDSFTPDPHPVLLGNPSAMYALT